MTETEIQTMEDLRLLAMRLLYTVRSGILSFDNIKALLDEGRRLKILPEVNTGSVFDGRDAKP